ncbi:probable 2-oxoglutarate-dependent dioxygenase AOP1, partial [Gastrolobium bilobum]|uniref:probable 2-oxoglutarate-dependent dioxygenase AOP1 n=1 Tax=Gastrolobium bilobum TaxID=150636 RepID=UPI002AB2C3EB
MGSQTPSQLPVVDFTDENLKPGSEAWLSACDVVRTALEDHGCFIARYDKVDKDLCSSVVSAMEELFNLPLETKKQETSNKLFHGYYGQIPFLPLYESFGIDDPVTVDGCQKFTQIMWPKGNDRFCESVNEYSKLLAELDHVAKRMVFESYGVDMKRCESFIESGNYLLRCLQYRPPQMDETDLGMQPHADLTMQSILHQVNNVEGLEVKLKDGEWIVVDPSPTVFVVMAGDGFKVWSNGRIRPCEHRVIMNAKETRYSMGLFCFNGDMVLTPEELVDEQHPLRYKPFDHFEYLRFFDKEKIKESDSRVKAYCGINFK